MTKLDPEFGRRLGMDEVDDPAPGVALGRVPEPGASRGNPALGRHAGHFGEHQRGTTDCPGTVVHQVPVAGHAVGGLVLRHRRHDDAVREAHPGQLERQEHRRPRHGPGAVATREPAFVSADEGRVAEAQVGVTDPLTAGEQAIRELRRFELDVSRDVLEPFHPVASRALELQGLEASLGLIGLKPGVDVGGPGNAAHQRDRVFHREFGSGADAEVRGMSRVADQHDVVVVPPAAQHPPEVEPGRPAQMAGIVHQLVAAEILGEQRLAERHRLLRRRPIEPVGPPGLFPSFDDDGREILAELVGVDLEPAVLGLFEGKRECGEPLPGAEPDEPALAHVDVRLERRGQAGPDRAVGAIGGNHQIGVTEPGGVVDVRLEMLNHAEPVGPLLQQVQQSPTADAGEPVASRADRLAPEMDVDVVPVIQARHDCGMGLGIRRLKARHGFVGEHHAPPKGVIGPIPLEHFDGRRRKGLFEQNGRVEASRAAAETDDPLHGSASSRSRAAPSSSRKAASRQRRRSAAALGVRARTLAAAMTRSKLRTPRAWVSP